MMPQQLDKVWSLGYTKTAKALSKTLLAASHSAQKSPVERASSSHGGFLRCGRLYRRFIHPSSHLLIEFPIIPAAMEMIKSSKTLIVCTPFLAGGYSGTVSLPFCDKVCNPFPWVISVKMLPQQLDKSCVLGYTKSAKAMSKLQFWHKRKIPLERTASSLLGDFPAWGVLTAYRSIHQATCKCRR